MVQLKVTLDQPTYEALVNLALDERRPVPWQAEVVIRRALGLPFPATVPDPQPQRDLATAGAGGEPPRAA